MFIQVTAEELVVGEKYKIDSIPNDDDYYTGIFKRNSDANIQVFDRFILHSSNLGKTKGRIEDDVYLCLNYYAFFSQKEQIQQAMEKRALDKILKRLVNDDFTW